jgi:aldehyde dehydrogenase (NAD+)
MVMSSIISTTALRQFFNDGNTSTYETRKAALQKLKNTILTYEQPIYNALYADLKKSKEECWATEIGLVIAELNAAINNLQKWMAPQKVRTNLLNLPSSSKILKEPLGIVLIIGAWNYPFYLLFNPLIGAIAAGNCVVVKPSEFAPATTLVMQQIIQDCFNPHHVLFVQGDGATVIPALMNDTTFDHVFFTGSTAVGKAIYKMAAEKLVPVTLELGGKSPCIVESDANIQVAAKRIVVTKFNNCGQICVAPDYILAHASIKEALIVEIKKCIIQFFGEDPSNSYNYGKIVNQKQFNRIKALLSSGQIVHGGSSNSDKLYIEPTILDNVDVDMPVMQEEIFGPILPILSFTTAQQALQVIAKHKNPLSFYVFTSSSEKEKFWLQNVAFGGGCVNNASWHLTNHHLPFGGRGLSGFGSYHGKFSFDVFTHKKAVMKTPNWFNPAIKFPPFNGRLALFKMLIR